MLVTPVGPQLPRFYGIRLQEATILSSVACIGVVRPSRAERNLPIIELQHGERRLDGNSERVSDRCSHTSGGHFFARPGRHGKRQRSSRRYYYLGS
jgi:hypothetical protein